MHFPHIKNLIFADGVGSCWQEDIAAVRAVHKAWTPPGDRWTTPASSNGMQFIRQPSKVLSIGLQLDCGATAWGDCLSVSFAGKSGRGQAMQINGARNALHGNLLLNALQKLSGQRLDAVEDLLWKSFPEWNSAIRFGVSQALVNAVAIANHCLASDVLKSALGTTPVANYQPALQGSCGHNWHDVVERMIVAGVKYLPQGQFENLGDELGADGSKLFKYLTWLKGRIAQLGGVALGLREGQSSPDRVITLDFHGALSQIFDGKIDLIADYIEILDEACRPFALHVESPVAADSFAAYLEKITTLTAVLRARKTPVKIIADEWANSLEEIAILATKKAVDGIHIKMPDTGSLLDSGRAVAICKGNGLFVLLGGSCTETATSARLAAHLAMATGPDALLVKPGISFDEGFSLMTNELAMIQSVRNEST